MRSESGTGREFFRDKATGKQPPLPDNGRGLLMRHEIEARRKLSNEMTVSCYRQWRLYFYYITINMYNNY